MLAYLLLSKSLCLIDKVGEKEERRRQKGAQDVVKSVEEESLYSVRKKDKEKLALFFYRTRHFLFSFSF